MAFDVNAARAQRLEAHGATFDFAVDGETFSLPTELDVDAPDKMAKLDQSDIKGLLRVLMADDTAADKLFAHKLSVQDLRAVMDAWRDATGASVGEDSPSAA